MYYICTCSIQCYHVEYALLQAFFIKYLNFNTLILSLIFSILIGMKQILTILTLLLFGVGSVAAQRSISGTVSTDKGETLVGATVLVKGTTQGVLTDLDGKYKLTVPENATLVFRFTGFLQQEIAVGASNVVDVTLATDAYGLQEQIVVGYGVQSKRNKVQSISTVEGDVLQNSPVVGAQQLLQGQAAGVQVTSASGVLGANASIRIRGAASISAGGNPLFVVDGVPLNDGQSAGLTFNLGGSTTLNALADINPNDIESMSVLKDASATAIYGSRGSNGVILITTKKGKLGKNNITFDYYTGTSKPTALLSAMSADQYRTFQKDYNNVTVPATGFDWPAAVLQTGQISNYSINFSGATDRTTYYLGGTFLRQSNYAIGNSLDRLNGRLNITHQANDWLKFGVNLGISRSVNDRIYSDNSTFAPLTGAYLQEPYVLPRDSAGAYVRTGFVANTLAIEELSTTEIVSRRTTGNTFLDFKILPGLTFRTDFGMDNIQTEETFRFPDIVSASGSAEYIIRQDNKWLSTNTLNYQKEFGKNSIGLLAGYSYEQSQYSDIDVASSGFAADGLRNVTSGATKTTTDATRTIWKLNSTFFRANYRLMDKYLIEASVRRDGSSRFGLNQRFGTFYGGGIGWVVSEEAFLKNVSWLNYLKLSVTHGITGNDRIANFASLGLYGSGILSDYSGLAGLRPTQPANPDLRWEQTTQTDFSISTKLFKGRVAIDASYYIKNTSNLLLNQPVPEASGITSLTRNVGTMENRGIDFQLTTVNVENRNFRWTTSFNIGTYTNKVTSLEAPGIAKDVDGNRFLESGIQRAVEGKSINEFYLVPYKGINAATGLPEWTGKTATGADTILNVIRAADRRYVGSAIPDFFGGITNTLTYKDFSFSFQFNFTKGNYVHLGELRFLENVVNSGFNKSTNLLNYWREGNKENAFAPAITASAASKTAYAQNSTSQLLDGSYLRLRNVTLSYTLRGKVLKTKAFESIRAYVMASNFFTLMADSFKSRGADPEVSDAGTSTAGAGNIRQGISFFSPPQAKMLQVGLTATF
jgi:TonB-dependent starch-binding outer membrane protein SusC